MYDSIDIKTSFIPREQAIEIKQYCKIFSGVEILTGNVLYELTTQELTGSYDYRIQLTVEYSEYQYCSLRKTPVKVDTEPYLRIRCSLHKLLLGHNVYGGPLEIIPSILFLKKFIEERINIILPPIDYWKLERIDVSNVFDLGSPKAVIEYIRNRKNFYYPRRGAPMPIDKKNNLGLYIDGSTNLIKFYYKYYEFLKHDYKRIKKYVQKNIDMLQRTYNNYDLEQQKYLYIMNKFDKIKEKSKNILRVELEIKKVKLKQLFNCVDTELYIKNINDKTLNDYFDIELKKLIHEGECKMEKVRDSILVRNRLNEYFDSTRLTNSLIGTWTTLATHGEKFARDNIPKQTFLRHKKQLIEAGIDWMDTDIQLNPNFIKYHNRKDFCAYPFDFIPVSTDKHALHDYQEVTLKLKQVA